MLRRRAGSRSRRVLYAVLGCVFALIGGIVVTRLYLGSENKELTAKTREAAVASEARQQQARAAAEQARASLPPDAGVARDWTFAACCNTLDSAQTSPALWKVLAYLRQVLGDPQGEPAEANPMDAPSESMDLTRHSKDEVLDSIAAYLAGLRALNEAESAHERGVFYVETAKDSERRLGHELGVGEAVACRAICEARRGDLPKAVRSYTNAQGMRRCVACAWNEMTAVDLWFVQCMADFAWRNGSFSQEQRESLVEGVGQRLSPERPVEMMLTRVERSRSLAHERLNSLRKNPFGFVGALVLGYEWGKMDKKLNVLPSKLPALFAQPSRPAIEALDEMAAADPDGAGYGYLRIGDVLEQAARLHLQNSRVDTARQVVRVAFALKDHKKAHGEYPKALDGLVPDPIPTLPNDPFLEKPLVYESDGQTFAIAYPEAESSGKSQVMRRLYRAMRQNRVLWQARE